LLAVLIYFIGDLLQIIAQGFGIRFGHDPELKHNQTLLWLLAIGSIPIGVGGLLFNKQAETVWRTPLVMGIMMIAIGIVMWIAEKWSRKLRDVGSFNLTDAVSIGLAQTVAIIPGCSRSGITISAGLFRNLTRESAARLSFLLSTPAIGAAAAKALWDIHKHGGGLHTLLNIQFVVGVSVSAITGCIVISWFLQYLRHSGLRPFVYYRVIFGIIVLALALIRRPA
ncbi:MAG TPA: undecaprenyl-diphosphate phosphatase, partial [Bryobacteraceae bacterium]|nr:undecaprenyl-diphosphate phosphatase [Bryobacteraceae bacterium]